MAKIMTNQSESKTKDPPTSKAIPEDPMAVRWAEKYSVTIEKYWNHLPSVAGSIIATLAVFILGSTFRGEWLLILVHFLKALRPANVTSELSSSDIEESLGSVLSSWGHYLEETYFKNFFLCWIGAILVSYVSYFGVGGFLHWYYYIRRRDRAEEWKCQPNKWLPPDLERHEIMLGSLSLIIGSTLSAIIACYIINGGWSMMYYDVSDYGWLWYLVSWPLVYIHQDYLTYWHHRWYHRPTLYKHFHKMHHKYKQPTAFSVAAIHPIEFIHMQGVLLSPMFMYPVHWTVFCTIIMYVYYHGIIDHSGINFKSYWWQPWQPDCIFHDNHHQYFHVNFGFNCEIWDKIHGTYRQKNKIYNEDIYYGQGKSLEECSTTELREDLVERESENVLAYRGAVRDEQVKFLKEQIK